MRDAIMLNMCRAINDLQKPSAPDNNNGDWRLKEEI